MPRRIEMPKIEVKKMQFYKEKGKYECEIDRILSHSKAVINNILSKKELYGTHKRTGRKKKLSDQ